MCRSCVSQEYIASTLQYINDGIFFESRDIQHVQGYVYTSTFKVALSFTNNELPKQYFKELANIYFDKYF